MHLNKYVLAAACTFAVAAHADTNFYVLGSVGQDRVSGLKKSDINDELTTAGATINSSKLDTEDTAYKLQVGYQVTENFAIEGGYVDLGQAEYKADVVGGSAKVTWEAKGWNLNAVGMVPITKNFTVLAKLGAIHAKVEAKATAYGAGGSASDSNSITRTKSVVGVGAAYAITDNLGVRVEAESYNSLGSSGSTGEADVFLLSAGVSYKF